MGIFVIDNGNFHYDFLIGLDYIKNFKLMQDEELNIIQCYTEGEKKSLNEEDLKNKDMNTNFPNLADVKVPDVLGNKREKHTPLYSEILNRKINNRCEVNFNEHINLHEFEISVNYLDLYQQTEIDTLIEKYKSIFAKDKYDVGTVRDYEAHIDLMVDKYC